MFFDKRIESKIPGTPAWNEKRDIEAKLRDIELLNHQLQRLIKTLPSEVLENETFKKEVVKANRFVVQSSILNLGYINNFQNEDVLIKTVELLLMALPLMEDKKKRNHLWCELQNPIGQTERICWGKHSEIPRLRREAQKNLNV